MLKRSPLLRKPKRRRVRKNGTHARAAVVYGVEIRGRPCAYCGAPAQNGDHVIPKSELTKYNRTAPEDALSIPKAWLAVEPACITCNVNKGRRRLVPPTWARRVKAMNRFFGGAPWRVWRGGVDEPAFREVHR